MSLINEALKKAQKQRTGDSPSLSSMPGIGGEPAARIAKRAKPVGFNSLLIRIGAGAIALVALLVGGIFLVRMLLHRPSAPPPAKPALVVEAASQPAESAPAIKVPAPSSSVANTFVLPIAAPATPPPAAPARVVAERKPEPPPPPPPSEPAKAQPPPKLEPKAISYIENLHVAGIRAAGAESKVLMSDRVYRIGDIVEHELGLKLTGISSSSLTFADEHGAVYTRLF